MQQLEQLAAARQHSEQVISSAHGQPRTQSRVRPAPSRRHPRLARARSSTPARWRRPRSPAATDSRPAASSALLHTLCGSAHAAFDDPPASTTSSHGLSTALTTRAHTRLLITAAGNSARLDAWPHTTNSSTNAIPRPGTPTSPKATPARPASASPPTSSSATTHDRVLLVNPNYKPDWDLPGGMAEANEPPIDAARRELREELGLDSRDRPLLLASNGFHHTALGTTRSSSSSTAESSRRRRSRPADHRRRDHGLPLLHQRRGARAAAPLRLAALHGRPRRTRDRPSALPPPRRHASLSRHPHTSPAGWTASPTSHSGGVSRRRRPGGLSARGERSRPALANLAHGRV